MTTRKVIADRYELETLIGSGGMGQVYRATDRKLRRVVAVKVMGAHLADDEIAVKRFVREMTATTMLEHENTIRVYDYGQTAGGELYLVMEHLEGETLAKAIFETAPMPLERVKRIGAQIARGLVAAHMHGIIHRDLKPGNVMLRNRYGDNDRVTILDFGIADLAGVARLTSSGLVAASAPYCSPEQANGDTVTPRSDLYMLGVVLYECVTGRLPFMCDTHVAYLYAHVHKTPERPKAHRPELPRWLDDLIVALLAKAPEQRPESADVVARLLAQNDLPTNQVPVLAIERAPEPPPVSTNHATTQRAGARRRWVPWATALALVAGGGVSIATLSSSDSDGSKEAVDPIRSSEIDRTVDPPTQRAPADAFPDTSPTATRSLDTVSEDVAVDTVHMDTPADVGPVNESDVHPTRRAPKVSTVWVDTTPSGGTVKRGTDPPKRYPTQLERPPKGQTVTLTFYPDDKNYKSKKVLWDGRSPLVVPLETWAE